ncbi:multidrug effflux MFS transporter, partial [bacterium]|nr:multidrug effflux MFS transporter [bacterium]
MKIQNERAYLLFLGLLATAPPLATDMYLPAIPDIAQLWQVKENIVNLSLILWFASFSIALLIHGSLSDKYGRKPVLITGLTIFVASSFLCAAATNVHQLILFRIFQGIGAAAPSSMSMAICRDRFEGKRRQQILAYIGIVLSVMPMLAPSIGSALLSVTTWRWIFITQGLIALLSLIFTFGYEETADKMRTISILRLFSRYTNLLSNRNYMQSCILVSIIVGPFFGYLALSPIVYMTIFGCSKQTFSILFGLNAMASMIGSYFCVRLTRNFSSVQLLSAGFVGGLLGGLALLIIGSISPYLFFAGTATYSFFLGMSRPISNHLVLEQVTQDIGSASSYMVFITMLGGS